MSKSKQIKASVSTENTEKKKGVLDGCLEWLFYGKGTVSEPWPTISELSQDKDVWNEIEKAQQAFRQPKK